MITMYIDYNYNYNKETTSQVFQGYPLVGRSGSLDDSVCLQVDFHNCRLLVYPFFTQVQSCIRYVSLFFRGFVPPTVVRPSLLGSPHFCQGFVPVQLFSFVTEVQSPHPQKPTLHYLTDKPQNICTQMLKGCAVYTSQQRDYKACQSLSASLQINNLWN